ncbi:hypothetical protein AB0B57_19300 [Micromonospora sp. NPDC049101]|uniref:hypothetical protein n=1 Tax=Micromonospora sp. NPDC049101 TaxID=3155032 RepID=UPI0033C7484A
MVLLRCAAAQSHTPTFAARYTDLVIGVQARTVLTELRGAARHPWLDTERGKRQVVEEP